MTSSAKIYPFNKNDKELFKDVVFLIEADSYAQHELWEAHHYRPTDKRFFIEDWEQVCMGHGITIGELDSRPIVVSINYALLNKKKVMFYYGCSQLVDHKMIEDWIKHYTLETIRWDNGHRWAHCDAMNFHHCMDAVGTHDKQRKNLRFNS